jgi:hypothetical protein
MPVSTGERLVGRNESCTLVVISWGRTRRKPENTMTGGRVASKLPRANRVWASMEEKDFFNIYNVLWVDLKDGLATRRGAGVVLVEAWKRANPQIRDVTLVEDAP